MSMQVHHTLMSQYKHGTASGIGSVSYESVANCVTPEVVIYGKCEQASYTGKNLFDVNNAKIIQAYLQVESDGAGTLMKSDACVSVYIPCEPNTTYTVSKISSKRFGVCFTNAVPEIGGSFSNGASSYGTVTKATRTAPSDAAYIVAWVYNSLIDTDITSDEILASLQIEVGETATEYEPYVGGVASPNPLYPQDIVCNKNAYKVNGVNVFTAPELYAVGNVRDEYYPLTGKIVRRCKKHILSSSDTITTYGTITFIYKGENPKTEQNTSICSHSKNVISSWGASFNGVYGVHSDNNITGHKYFRPPNDSIDTVDKFKAWLDEQTAAGTPVTLVYVLAEPVIEYVEPVVLTSKRSIGKKIILDSSCDIRAYTYQSTKNGIAVYGLFPTDEVVYDALTCTHESSYKDDGTEYSFMFINANLKRLYWIGILDEMGMSRAQFISWLDEQKAAGTPVTVTYFPNGSFNTITESGDITGTQIDVKYLTHS